ncbi:MAG TPA: S9 family peptidase [Vicinamibacteria bacterium]|nr:S9 family peptidase [Vicinamibacteria bacterium]
MSLVARPRGLALLAFLLWSAAPLRAQTKDLTIEDIFDPKTRVDFGQPVHGLAWLDDTHYEWPRLDPQTRLTDHLRVDALTGADEPLFDAGALQAALARVEGVGAEEAHRLAHESTYVMNGRRTALLVVAADDLFLFDFQSKALTRLTRTPGTEQEPSFSPDGTHVAFVRGGDLHVVDIGGHGEKALTGDGSADVLNGILDWVYQEEIYGRGDFKGYWWSPDSRRIAVLQLREARVPRYPIVDDIVAQPRLDDTRYPKAGDPNPEARLAIVDAVGGSPRWIDLARYAAEEPLVVDVGWSPDSRRVVFQVQNRVQTWLDLDDADASTLRTRTLFREKTKAWVDRQADGLLWMADGGFLWLSERTGWKHVYRYRGDGSLVGPVTRGEWEARTLHGVDEKGGWVYFSGTEHSAIGGDVYRIHLDGTGLERLSHREGTHTASFDPSFARYLDTWSDVTTPPQVRLHRADGGEVRVVDADPVPALAHYRLGRPEFVPVRTRDGFPMEAMVLRPPDFDPARRYPVYQHTYGGPHAPQVKNVWGSTTYLFHQLLAERGVVVWICDNRSASGKGAVSAWPVYRNFGELELRDVEDGVSWLRQQPWVDATRIGIYGWSFGGYMVTYALTHSHSFTMGIAGGPVTDWQQYDSVYTERFMDLPASNPEGYRKSAPRLAAADLHGRLLLAHGAADDNVHPQNTMRFVYELQKAERPFRLMLYPRSRHGVTEPALVEHLNAMKLAFVEETLLGKPSPAP